MKLDGRTCGRTRYASDVPASGVLSAAFVASTEPHALLRRVDTSRARALPGVHAVITGRDIGPRLFGRAMRDYPVLAVDRVLFAGQRIAAVAAVDAATAQEAARLVEVDYEPLPAVLGIRDAVSPGSVELHEGYAAYTGALEHRPGRNVQGFAESVTGEGAAAFGDCDEIHEHVFTWPRMHVAPIEPHACLVAAGRPLVHVYAAHKEPYSLRRDLAHLSGRPEEDFVVHVVNIGGDFGAKGSPFVEGACYFLSEAAGRPVRATLSYVEELTTTSSRHAGSVRLRTGLSDGKIRAHEVESEFDGGAFGAIKPVPGVVLPISGLSLASYEVPHRSERSTVFYTNALPGGHCRCPGQFQIMFACESQMDMLARSQGEHPIAFRLRHTGNPRVRRILEELRASIGDWPEDLDTGIGISVFDSGYGAGETTVACVAGGFGVELSVTVPDQGAGSYESFRRLAARILRVPLDSVSVRPVTTATDLQDAGAGASRVTAVAGGACREACKALLRELGDPPHELRDRPAERGDDVDGVSSYWIRGRLAALGRDSIETQGTWREGNRFLDEEVLSHGALALQVAVDRGSGVMTVRRALLVADTGLVVNPVGHRGQLEGGFVFGLSQTRFEELATDAGQVVCASLGDYKIAAAGDVPPLEIVLVGDFDDGEGDFADVKPVGELVTSGVPAALANAVADAVGVRITELPVTSERVWRALQEA